ncbi:putative kinetochore protein spc25 [Podosphaera aphanis]|nr:putative kinetochore protein spc25 [Podosphaera aphanis]
MASTHEPQLPSSAMRPPLSSANAVSIADSLPSVNFEFDELRDRMAKFTIKFDNFIEQGRKRVLEERNQFRVTLAELKEDQRMKKRDIEILVQKSNTHKQSVAKEEAETDEMKATVASLSAQRDAQLSTKEQLQQQIKETQKQIEIKLAAQRIHAQQIEAQSRFNLPELEIWTSHLCMEIDGAGQQDRLKFVFTHLDDRDWEREACFELDTSRRDYDISYCKPKIDRAKVEGVLDKVNESRDLRVLLKGMRELFIEIMKS